MNMFLGVDPGVNGALAFYCPETSFLEVQDVPTYEEVVSGKKRRRIDIPSLLAILGENGEDAIAMASLERVSSQPRDGHAGAFAFGEAFGTIKACLAAQRVPFDYVLPRPWKQEFRIAGKDAAGGDAARECVSRLMPGHGHYFRRKKDHNRADAALIAIYTARRHFKQSA